MSSPLSHYSSSLIPSSFKQEGLNNSNQTSSSGSSPLQILSSPQAADSPPTPNRYTILTPSNLDELNENLYSLQKDYDKISTSSLRQRAKLEIQQILLQKIQSAYQELVDQQTKDKETIQFLQESNKLQYTEITQLSKDKEQISTLQMTIESQKIEIDHLYQMITNKTVNDPHIIDELLQNINTLFKDNRILSDKLSDKKRINNILIDKVDLLNNKLSRVSNQKETAFANQKLKSDFDELEKSDRNKKRKLDELLKENSYLHLTYQEKIEILNEQNKRLETANQAHQKDNDTLSKDNKALELSITNFQYEEELYTKELESKDNIINELNSELDNKNKKIKEITDLIVDTAKLINI